MMCPNCGCDDYAGVACTACECHTNQFQVVELSSRTGTLYRDPKTGKYSTTSKPLPGWYLLSMIFIIVTLLMSIGTVIWENFND